MNCCPSNLPYRFSCCLWLKVERCPTFQLDLQVFLLSVVEGVNVVLFQLALQVFLLSVVEGRKRCPIQPLALQKTLLSVVEGVNVVLPPTCQQENL